MTDSSSPGDAHRELLELAGDQCNGSATPAEIARLEQLLRRDSAARAAYLRYCFLHADLSFSDEVLLSEMPQVLGEIPAASPPAPPIFPSHTLQRAFAYLSHPVRFSLLVAVVTTISLILTSAQFRVQGWAAPERAVLARRETVPPPGRPVALLMHADGVARTAGARTETRGEVVQRDQVVKIDSGSVVVNFLGGAEITLQGPAAFQAVSSQAGFLKQGKLSAKVPPRARGFTIRTPNIEVVDLGTEFEVEVAPSGLASVAVLQGSVEVRSRLRTPHFYWNFDDRRQVGAEAIRQTIAALGEGARPTAGLIGQGALDFNNTSAAYVDVGAEGFDFGAGVTLEVLMTPRWNGLQGSYEEIFRKEDGDRRLLLAFQHDLGGAPAKPLMPQGPALAFGLHLEGQGYNELDLPLDGLEGRPSRESLLDGRPHHVVAIYDALSGLKAIYVDGIRRLSVQYPKHTRIVSGGVAQATIGNAGPHAGEPFDGVLDEVAVYDFALTPHEIAAHFANVQQHLNYFGFAPAAPRSWQSVTPLSAGQRMQFAAGVGLPLPSSLP